MFARWSWSSASLPRRSHRLHHCQNCSMNLTFEELATVTSDSLVTSGSKFASSLSYSSFVCSFLVDYVQFPHQRSRRGQRRSFLEPRMAHCLPVARRSKLVARLRRSKCCSISTKRCLLPYCCHHLVALYSVLPPCQTSAASPMVSTCWQATEKSWSY